MRYLLTFFLTFFIFITTVSTTLAQTSSVIPQIPGVDCGMAEAQNGADKCCYTEKQSLPKFPFEDVARKVPVIGDKIDNYDQASKAIDKFQDKYGNAVPCLNGTPSTTDLSSPSCKCELLATASAIPSVSKLCTQYITSNPNELTACQNCAQGGGFWSGLGCIPLNVQNLITSFLLSLGIGFGGLIALICIVYSAITLQTSQGNPEKIKKAQENMTSCILGLLVIIFSVFILRLIGVSILNIPFLK